MRTQFLKLSACLLAAGALNISGYSQNVGINATGVVPDNSAGLDVNFNNKGLLIPRVALTSVTDNVTIPSPATSLLVYNTGAGGLAPAGYYYNAGTTTSPNWVRLLPATGTGGAWLLNGNAGTTAGTHFVGTTDAQDLVFKTNNTERMRILQSNGNVGIGLNNPNDKLHVAFGNVRIGEINPPNTGTFPSYGRFLYFSGGPASALYYSDNTDPLWIARYNVASDVSELRVNIGDNCDASNTDAFVIQSDCSGGPAGKSFFRVESNGLVKIGTNSKIDLGKLSVYDSSDVAFVAVGANLNANGTNGYVGYALVGSSSTWRIYHGDPDGGFGVGPRYFEIWEYPANPGTTPECCRRRFVIESTYGMYTGNGPTNLILQNNGNVCTYGSFVSCSDERLKKDFMPLSNVINKIIKVNPFYYKWNTEKYPNRFNDTSLQIGFKASELEKLFPEVVSMDSEGFKQIKYDKLTVILWKAIQEQQQIIDNLRQENQTLKQELYQQKQSFFAELQKIKQHIGLGEAKK